MLLMKQISGLLTALGLKADASDLTSHENDNSNPHNVTKSQVGLGNVDNTADMDKPVSNAMQGELNTKADQIDLDGHTGNSSNPHGVTHTQVGADMAGTAIGLLNNHNSTHDHSKLHNKDTDDMLASGTGNQVTANELRDHIDSDANPHSVTKNQVGLGNVTNDAQIRKAASSVDGKIPVWVGTDGNRIGDGYDVEDTNLIGNAGALVTADVIKAKFDNLVGAADAMIFEGVIDCSMSPNYPAGDKGSTWKVSNAGKIGGSGGPNVEVGDMIICIADEQAGGIHATVGAYYTIVQVNVDGAVTGPGSVTDQRIAIFDGTSGKVIKQSTHRVTDLQEGLTAMQDVVSPSAPGAAGTQITIENALSAVPSSAVPVMVFLNGLLVPHGDPSTQYNVVSLDGRDLTIKPDSSFGLETTDEITILYSV